MRKNIFLLLTTVMLFNSELLFASYYKQPQPVNKILTVYNCIKDQKIVFWRNDIVYYKTINNSNWQKERIVEINDTGLILKNSILKLKDVAMICKSSVKSNGAKAAGYVLLGVAGGFAAIDAFLISGTQGNTGGEIGDFF